MNDLERRTLLGAAGIGAIAALAHAKGPLNPPAGPVAPTGRTLDEVYDKIPALAGDGRTPIAGGVGPTTIAAPGSYILTAPISGPTGIFILADDVVLDLNGHRVNVTDPAGAGVNIGGGVRSGVTVRNGTIVGGAVGVLASAAVSALHLEQLRIIRPRQQGVNLPDLGNRCCIVRNCHTVDVGLPLTASDPTTSVVAINLVGDAHRVDSCTVARLYNTTPGGTLRGINITGNGANNGVIVERCVLTHEVALATAIGISMSGGGGVYRDNSVMLFNTGYSTAQNTDGGGNI